MYISDTEGFYLNEEGFNVIYYPLCIFQFDMDNQLL